MIWNLLRERSRARTVRKLGLLDLPTEPDFERFVQQAANAFAAPISVVTLLHEDKLWMRAATGMQLACLPKKEGFCTYAIDRGEPLEVCDARDESRFRSLPSVVGEPFIRYYLGAALTLSDGTDVGALCVLDTRPRQPASRDQRAYLVGLARQATLALERRAHMKSSLAA